VAPPVERMGSDAALPRKCSDDDGRSRALRCRRRDYPKAIALLTSCSGSRSFRSAHTRRSAGLAASAPAAGACQGGIRGYLRAIRRAEARSAWPSPADPACGRSQGTTGREGSGRHRGWEVNGGVAQMAPLRRLTPEQRAPPPNSQPVPAAPTAPIIPFSTTRTCWRAGRGEASI